MPFSISVPWFPVVLAESPEQGWVAESHSKYILAHFTGNGWCQRNGEWDHRRTKKNIGKKGGKPVKAEAASVD